MTSQAPPPPTGILHVALTATDAEASARWYGEVLGCRRVTTVDHQGGYGIVLATADERVWLVLHQHTRNDGSRFDEARTGLDHVCLQVDGRQALQAWAAWLDALGVDHDPVRFLEQFDMWVLVFRDPDGIPLELITY
jgi:glyoxylase I family protein